MKKLKDALKRAPDRPIRIGSRGSPLALWQAHYVLNGLRASLPELKANIQTIRTAAEEFPDRPPEEIGVGVFTREIDQELLDGRIDLAVHSLKDLPSRIDPALVIAAVTRRESPLDAFVGTAAGKTELWDLPPGSTLGTGSPRRKAQLLHRRPDFRIVPLRGNVETRIRKATAQGMSGTILAHAGLRRLEQESVIRHLIPSEWIVPAVGQGAIGILARADREEMLQLALHLDHPTSRLRIEAERAFLATLRGGCQVPAGALAEIRQKDGSPPELWMVGFLSSTDGEQCRREILSGPPERAEEIGRSLAEGLLSEGGREILEGGLSPSPKNAEP